MKVLMVCLGNICRSPLAEGLLRDKIKSSGISIWVDSAGTSGHHVGEAPDRRMQKTALTKGVDLSDLRSRKFKKKDFKKFDLIYVMDASNYKNVIELADDESEISKVKYILNEIYPDQNLAVPDPYYGGSEGFEEVYQLLDQATDKIIKKLV